MRPVVLINLAHPVRFFVPDEKLRERTARALPEFELVHVDHQDPDYWNVLSRAEIYCGWIFPPKWIPRATSLKWIHTPAAGTDFIDSPELGRSGILVTHSTGFHGIPMAVHAVGMVLGFAKGLFYSYMRQRNPGWWRDEITDEIWDLEGGTAVIVGCGAIGLHVARRLQDLGMRCVGVRRNPPAPGTDGIEWASVRDLDRVLPGAVVVVNLLPFSPDTEGFFDDRVFGRMGPGCLFINLGRGKTVDESALLRALDSGAVSWAGLDVLREEPTPDSNPLRFHPRVVITPHSSTYGDRFIRDGLDQFVERARAYLAGEDLPNVLYPGTRERRARTSTS